MKSFIVSFHQADDVDNMQVQKLNKDDVEKATAGGARHLFELEINNELFTFFDAEDADGTISYMMLQYEEDDEEPVACYSFKLEDFYQFMALYLNGLESSEETDEEDEETEEYGPIHHLAHLLFHIVDEGQDLEA